MRIAETKSAMPRSASPACSGVCGRAGLAQCPEQSRVVEQRVDPLVAQLVFGASEVVRRAARDEMQRELPVLPAQPAMHVGDYHPFSSSRLSTYTPVLPWRSV